MDKKLQDLNLKDVSSKTQIEIDFLNALVEKDFKKLSRFNVKGFLKILTREYGFDFTQFLEEYDAFINESKENEPDNVQIGVSPKLDAYSNKSSGLWIWFLLAFVIVALLWFIYQYGWFNSLTNPQNSQNPSSSLVQIIDQAQDNIKNVVTEENSTQEENSSSSLINTEEVIFNDNNQTNTAQTNYQIEDEGNKEAIFSTSGRVWVGFIDLNSGAKTARVTDNNFSVDLSKDQLLLIGATALVLIDDEGKEQNFPAGNSKRFLVKNGKIKSINLTEFMSYNKGKEW